MGLSRTQRVRYLPLMVLQLLSPHGELVVEAGAGTFCSYAKPIIVAMGEAIFYCPMRMLDGEP